MRPVRDTVIIMKKVTLQTKNQPIAVKMVLEAPVTLITVATLVVTPVAILAVTPAVILVATLAAIPVVILVATLAAIPVVILVAVKTEVERHQLRSSPLQDCSYRI